MPDFFHGKLFVGGESTVYSTPNIYLAPTKKIVLFTRAMERQFKRNEIEVDYVSKQIISIESSASIFLISQELLFQ